MTFEAKYGGRGGVCDEAIAVGDECAYSEDVVVHADCEASARGAGRRAPRPVCNRCFMEIPVSGDCGCES